MLERFLGNTALKADLSAALAGDRLAHSLLLVGEAGCGAGFAARCLAADYLFPQGGPQAESVLRGECGECLELRGSGASGDIKIEDVRRVRDEVYKTGLSSEGRVVILYGAQALNGASANALLKVLEEPPEGVLFLLTANSLGSILPTIRSRCCAYTIAPVSTEECMRALAVVRPPLAPEAARRLALIFDGQIGKALAAATGSGRSTLALAEALAGQVAAGQEYELLSSLAATEKDKPAAKRLFELLRCLAAATLRDASLSPLSGAQAARIIRLCDDAGADLAANRNTRLALTRFGIHCFD